MAKKDKSKRTVERDAVFHIRSGEDLKYWVQTERSLALRAFDLIDAIMRNPFTGAGKPEPLRYDLAGAWSRRLTREHRIVYVVPEDRVTFLQARYHY